MQRDVNATLADLEAARTELQRCLDNSEDLCFGCLAQYLFCLGPNAGQQAPAIDRQSECYSQVVRKGSGALQGQKGQDSQDWLDRI